MESEGEPIPFIEIGKGKDGAEVFSITAEAEKFLQQSFQKKVAVLTIAGPQRTGKSFLANRFVHRMQGFAIGPTTNPCTKGIWLWGQPIKLNDDTDLIILDTEGLNSTPSSPHRRVVIYINRLGHIDESAIENLSLVIHLSDNIKISKEGQKDQDLAKYFPDFKWVLRDFSLDLQGKSPKQGGKEAEKKNLIRQKIREYFANRECVPFVRPLSDEQQLAHIEMQNWESLRPEFTKEVDKFIQKVLIDLRPKVIQNKTITGDMFLGIAKSYLEAINSDSAPQIVSSLERVLQMQMKKIFDYMVNDYKQRAEVLLAGDKLPMDSEEMSAKYKELVTETKKRLAKMCENLGPGEKAMIDEKLMQGVEKDYQNRVKMNEDKTISESKRIFSLFENNLKLPNYGSIKDSYEEITTHFILPFKQNYEAFLARFLKDFKGTPQKYRIAAEVMPQIAIKYYEKVIEVFKKIAETENEEVKFQLLQAREGEESLRNSLAEYESLVEMVKKDRTELKNQLASVEKSSNREIESLTLQLEEMKIKLELMRNENQGTKKGGNVDYLETFSKQKNNEIFQLKQTIESLEQENERLRFNSNRSKELTTKSASEKETEADELLERQVEAEIQGDSRLIEYVSSLKSKIKQLESSKKQLEQNKTIYDQMNAQQKELEKAEEEEVGEVVEKEKLILLCNNPELINLIEGLYSNMEKKAKRNDKKLKLLLYENGRLKAQIVDYKENEERIQKKMKDYASMKEDFSKMERSTTAKKDEFQTNIQQKERDFTELVMSLAQVKGEATRVQGEKEHLFYFLQESIKKIKKKNNHFDYAVSLLSEKDLESVKTVFAELGLKYFQ